MGINREQEKQITAIATTWLLEKKVVAVEPLRLYLAQYAELHLSDEDIAECLLRLFRQRGDLQEGLTLEQGFTFFVALIGHWMDGYDILAIEVIVAGHKVYAFYGVYEQMVKLIGVSTEPKDLQAVLNERGIDILRWVPKPTYRALLGSEAEIDERWNTLTQFAARLNASSNTTKVVLI